MGALLELASIKDDMRELEAAANAFAHSQNSSAKLTLLGAMRQLMDRYGFRHVQFEKFTLRRTFRGVRVDAKLIVSGRHCPGCGACIYEDYGSVHVVQVAKLDKSDDVGYCNYRCDNCKAFFRKWEGEVY